ncbi:alpha/beta fold hydrolase [Sphingobacterium puteale]|uniref:alpha/beta fold hydrolase n=1 Tax=Sphingobacterium puteale TaxID=2420510 RepID=UPI003D9819DA
MTAKIRLWSNVPLYPSWQQYFGDYQPEMLIVYGKDDYIFPGSGAEAFKKDVKNLEFHLFDAGHFALKSLGEGISAIIEDFLDRKIIKHSIYKIALKKCLSDFILSI